MQALTTEELQKMKNANPDLTVINTLTEEHFQKKHIPDSINIPVDADDFTEQVENQLGGKEKPVVVYCASLECDASDKAAKKLESAGFQNVYDFEAGMQAWQEAGNPVEGSQAKAGAA